MKITKAFNKLMVNTLHYMSGKSYRVKTSLANHMKEQKNNPFQLLTRENKKCFYLFVSDVCGEDLAKDLKLCFPGVITLHGKFCEYLFSKDVKRVFPNPIIACQLFLKIPTAVGSSEQAERDCLLTL